MTEANNLLRDMNKRTVCLLWLIVLRVKSSLFHHIALTMGCFDYTIPWPILLVESLRLSYSPRPLFSLTWTETTYHTTNVCYFRHLDRVLQFQTVINYWLFEIYNKCFFHRTEIWWWLLLETQLNLKNWCLEKRPKQIHISILSEPRTGKFVTDLIKQTLLRTETIRKVLAHVKKLHKYKGRMWISGYTSLNANM